jgi:hypothetical protein
LVQNSSGTFFKPDICRFSFSFQFAIFSERIKKIMNKILAHLKPQPLFDYFEQICQIPRPSKKEEKIRQFLLDFAKMNRLEVKTDEAGNVLISKPAAPGQGRSAIR